MKEKRFITFRDGSRGIVRPISPADQRAFIEGFESLSEESRFRRFFFNKKALTATDLERLSHPDGINHIAYGVAAVEENGSETPISISDSATTPSILQVLMVTMSISNSFSTDGWNMHYFTFFKHFSKVKSYSTVSMGG